jgi:molybdopterin/thiamine biosynthesis adenylyltransferase
VEISNLASQGYLQNDLNQPKVDTTGQLCRQINSDLQLHVCLDRFRRSMEIGNCVFCCVDSIQTRKFIWEAVKDQCNFFADGRMSAEVLRILTACDEQSRKHYPQTLFTAQEAHTGVCTRFIVPISPQGSCWQNLRSICVCCRLPQTSRSICWLRR